MEELGGSNPTDEISTGFSLRRLPRAERAVDDPIRGMEGMLVDEYGRSDVLLLIYFNAPVIFLPAKTLNLLSQNCSSLRKQRIVGTNLISTAYLIGVVNNF